jgi:hypothetical protein
MRWAYFCIILTQLGSTVRLNFKFLIYATQQGFNLAL